MATGKLQGADEEETDEVTSCRQNVSLAVFANTCILI